MLIRLQARAAGANIRRAWTAITGHDLFGAVYLEITFGRIGGAGQTRHHSFERDADAARFLLRALRRRARSPRRIGVGYRVVEATDSAESLLRRAGIPLDPGESDDPGLAIPAVPKRPLESPARASQLCFPL